MIKNCTFGSCRNLFPCKDKIWDYTYFSNLKVTIDNKNLKVISSGKLLKVQKFNNSATFYF